MVTRRCVLVSVAIAFRAAGLASGTQLLKLGLLIGRQGLVGIVLLTPMTLSSAARMRCVLVSSGGHDLNGMRDLASLVDCSRPGKQPPGGHRPSRCRARL